jgi:prophage tail gpP-like protein
MTDVVNEGDIITLTANDVPLGVGLVDQPEIEVDHQWGEKWTITGRDLMAQLEDQDAISFDSTPIWSDGVSLFNGVAKLCADTRINVGNIVLQGSTPTQSNILLATEPGESKLAALQRFLEPLNCVAWMSPAGKLIVGKPDMAQGPSGLLICSKELGLSNVLSMRVTRASTQIPNIIVPIWTGQETTVNRVSPEQALVNSAAGPNRLLKLGHRLPKTVVVSTPQGSDAQSLSGINAFQAGAGNVLQSYAKREIARKNVGELQVQAVVAGHCDEAGNPYRTDSVYHITFDRGDVDENMYLYQVEYVLSEEGQRTNLYFCRLGSIVADNAAPGTKSVDLSTLASLGGL